MVLTANHPVFIRPALKTISSTHREQPIDPCLNLKVALVAPLSIIWFSYPGRPSRCAPQFARDVGLVISDIVGLFGPSIEANASLVSCLTLSIEFGLNYEGCWGEAIEEVKVVVGIALLKRPPSRASHSDDHLAYDVSRPSM
jgi:hypothetical protein